MHVNNGLEHVVLVTAGVSHRPRRSSYSHVGATRSTAPLGIAADPVARGATGFAGEDSVPAQAPAPAGTSAGSTRSR